MADKEVNGTKLVEKPAKIPIIFQLGEMAIDGATVQPMSFQQFSDYIGEAQGMKAPKTFEARLRRLRLAKQVQYFVNGTAVPVGTDDVVKLGIIDARTLVSRLDEGEGPPGKIIRDGDGVDKSIVYELGTPIPVGPGKPPIKELEFHAQTYGEIEDIMSAPDSIQQTALLIATIAKPLGHSLQALPSWALGQIKIADGVTISRLVTPHFLGSPDE